VGWWHVGDSLHLVRVRFQALRRHNVSHVLNRINFELHFVFSFLSCSRQNEPHDVVVFLRIRCGNDEAICDDVYP